MIRKNELDGVCLVYSGTEERSIRVLSRSPPINEPSNAPPINESSNETNNSVITQQPTDTVPKTDTIQPTETVPSTDTVPRTETIPKTETDDVVMDTLDFDCFLCYRWWFCYK